MKDIQEIMVYLAVAAAVFFLIKKYLFKKKNKKSRACGGTDCGCH